MEDTFKTISKPSQEVLHKDRKSKFFGYAFPLSKEDEVKSILDTLRKKHPTANHVCYAWQLGVESVKYRANDDGEPNNSAGMPIYGQIQSFGVTNVLVAVVRIFGGVKLGVGGLIQAYREGARLALETSEIVERVEYAKIDLIFEYPGMNKVMRILKQHQIHILSQKMELNCELKISVQKSKADKMIEIFQEVQGITVNKPN
ncbi:IMPACT family protein [Flagellimonas meridianipacifica]|uniref:Putative YigZ family protein n=1 Tax=Flagellimonas meridianipacifica TaxID=1080225 RepID=A0A2T0MAQ4_9FLAO|nr:YigZ family protein [Allomuricauda pacifica]PRX54492.1 putative YigZ family protein [Allomuricauda pacifica]